MAKQQLEVTVNSKTDVFQVKNFLQRCRGIKKVYIITCQSLHIYYDDRLILPKTIAKLIGTVGREKGHKRFNNITGLRELNKSAGAA